MLLSARMVEQEGLGLCDWWLWCCVYHSLTQSGLVSLWVSSQLAQGSIRGSAGLEAALVVVEAAPGQARHALSASQPSMSTRQGQAGPANTTNNINITSLYKHQHYFSIQTSTTSTTLLYTNINITSLYKHQQHHSFPQQIRGINRLLTITL